MREIKFRARDKKYTFMTDTSENYDIYIGCDGTIHEIGEWSGYSGGGKTDDDVTEQYDLMQYTGLKDKNGIEIYEGDIVEYEQHLTKKVIRSEVYYKEIASAFGIKNNDRNNLFCELPVDFEVIGNIYQNPELLK